MYTISTIVFLKKMDFCVWNVVFQMDNEPLEYTTDFLYLLKEEKWVFNSLITHELPSLMEGYECIYCREGKIACSVCSRDFKQIKTAFLVNENFQKEVAKEIMQIADNISTEFIVVNDKEEWKKLADDNRFYGNVMRIKRKNEKKVGETII